MNKNICRATARMLRGVLNGEAGSDSIRPDHLLLTRDKKNTFTFAICNSKGEKLIDLCEADCKVGGSVHLTDIHRSFNFTLEG